MCVTTDGDTIISGSHDRSLKVWSLSTSHCVSTLEGHQGWISSVCATSDGKKIVSGSHDSTLKVEYVNWRMSVHSHSPSKFCDVCV